MSGKKRDPSRIAAWISGTFAVASLIFGYCGFGKPFDEQSPIKVTQAIVLCAWIVLPPLWFWCEYFFIWDRQSGYRPSLEEFKYGQDVASKIWLGLVTALLILYFGKDLARGLHG
jgi:hypothetical protein